ncbi:hypothetical protein B0H63DRAFT_551307 [Podospora didyma]|uniref:NACHT domain-containing protein n=1 Tax=Podospora didyma TaxID=330526 RepID=A0AAE0K9F6_9PEZI|nr:hypothetical protein B0H63DRAFT_551307 [Podospora didyma]
MEPASAIGIAAATLQFLDFGVRVLLTSYDVYKSPSGQSAKQVALSTIVNDLDGLLDQVKVATSMPLGDALESPVESQLFTLVEECKALIVPLRKALGRLQRKGSSTYTFEPRAVSETRAERETSFRKSFRCALQVVWKESEIVATISKLENMKRRMMTATLFVLWYQSKQREVQFSKRLDEMAAMLTQLVSHTGATDEETAHHTVLQPSSQQKKIPSPEKMIEVLNDTQTSEAQEIRDDLVKYLWDHKRHPGQSPHARTIGSEAITGVPEATRHQIHTSIVETLAFDTIRLREDSIPDAFRETFSWIFQTPSTTPSGNLSWPSFPDWLGGDRRQPYWITGKPGSGKSTLVKFVLQSPSLEQHLNHWAGSLPLLITRYYAWIAGTTFQKSCEGLMRTLFYQTLDSHPSLIPAIDPRRWSLLTTLRCVVDMPRWELWEIEEAFEALLSHCGETIKLVIFIDGLDEFDSPPFQVIHFIQKVNSRNGVKICVASRQWHDFNDEFKSNPMLRMQDLTADDMTHFVRAKLAGNPGFQELRSIFPEDSSRLVDEIVKKSNGVFLWVSIVVKSLLEALTEGDGLPELQSTLNSLPSSIAQLYDAIWSTVSNRNKSKSAELLVTFKAAHGVLDYVTLWLAEEEQSPPPKYTAAGILDQMKRRLDSRTRGILEINQDGIVQYLHRTARDWISKPEVWEKISSGIEDVDFDPYILLVKAETLGISDPRHLSPYTNSMSLLWRFVSRSLWYASNVRDTDANRLKLVHILNTFNVEVEKIAGKFMDDISWSSPVQGVSRTCHWSTSQGCDSTCKPKFENTFLGLAAQFCIIPYLRAILLSDPTALKVKASTKCLSPLENAVFGHQNRGFGINDSYAAYPTAWSGFEFSISQEKRLQTIALLLEQGANPEDKIRFVGKTITSVVKALKKRELELQPASNRYWTEVANLLAASKKERSLGFRFGLRTPGG